ncbi:MAG TPA: hypothetical protein VGN23_16250 [Verrucomicrobiae bacterium]|jgi:prepilin-type processing-associated H-X9-DG protein
MEPERKIEKWLRAFAKKRRADAGEPLKLHPATRRLLQSEVARMPRPPEESALTLWQLLRQEWSWLAGFALIIFFCAILFVPALNLAKHKSQSASTENNLKEISLAMQNEAGNNNGKLPATLDDLTNELRDREVLTDPRNGKPFTYVAGGETLDDLQTNAVLAYSSEEKSGRAVLFADGHVDMETPEEFAKKTQDMPNQLAMNHERVAPMTKAEGIPTMQPAAADTAALPVEESASTLSEAAPQPAGAGRIGGFGGSRSAASMPAPAAAPEIVPPGQQAQAVFYRNKAPQHSLAVDQQIQTDKVGKGLSQIQTPVLANFQLLQNGNEIRVVDSDGSVYAGSVLAAKDSFQNEPVQTTFAARRMMGQVNNQNFQSSTEGVPFRVTGVNRSSQQTVVFEGSLSAIPIPAGNAQNFSITENGSNAATVTGSIGPAQQQNQQQSSNSRITGTATIGQTNQVEIDAVQVTQ